MANFVSRSVVKSAVRTLPTEIPTLAAFSEVVDDILTNNPFLCTDYEVGGVSHDGTEKSRESYTARFAYEDGNAETIGTTTVKCPTTTAFNAVVTAVPAATAINTAIGELYNVAITRSAVTVSGYEADAILTAIEDWADGVPALN